MLAVIYLIFNEGYSAGEGDQLVRGELCSEAIRLGRLLARLMPDEAEVHGLLGLMLLHDARRGARVDDRGDYVALDEQDRTRWDAGRVREGLGALAAAAPLHRPGPYQLQAAIAAEHIRGAGPADPEPDWRSIAQLYAALARIAPSPVVEVNRAVAVARAEGPDAGLALLAPLLGDPALDGYQPLHAAHAELLRRSGDAERGGRAYERAISLSDNAVQRAELERRRDAPAIGQSAKPAVSARR